MAHPQTKETREKISKANKGRKRTPESIEKQRQSRLKGFREGRIKIPWAGTKGIMTWNKKGAESSSWRGGKWKDKNGYIVTKQGMEHRLVMEMNINRKLCSWEQVHHINAIKDDNRIENLRIVTKKTHKGIVLCPYCNNKFEIK